MKFSCRKGENRQRPLEMLEKLDVKRLRNWLYEFQYGTELEVIVRPKIRWDVDQMRKYFHGPVLDFVQNCFKEKGYAYGRQPIKEALKKEFIGVDAALRNSELIPVAMSTTQLDFESYKKFLTDINDWCIDTFGAALPEADESDLGD